MSPNPPSNLVASSTATGPSSLPSRHQDLRPSSTSPASSSSSSIAFPALPGTLQPPASSTTTTAAAAAGPSDDTTIHGFEMAPLTGHRRRKSSLMNPAAAHLSTPPGGRTSPHNPNTRRKSGSFSAQKPTGHDRDDYVGKVDDDDDDDDWRRRDSFGDDQDLRDDEEMGLTTQDRARKQKQRRKLTRLDQRIAREKNLSVDEQTQADKSVMRRLMINGGLILLWYIFSLSISLYNKWMFDKDRLNFAFPLFTTAMHMLVQFSLASLVLYFFPSFRPYHKHTSDLGRSRHEDEPNSSKMSKLYYLTRVGPCGAATSLDIGLGNMSLKSITLTFYTMCKSSSLAFVLIFAFVFRLEKPTWRLVAIIATMTVGVILMVSGEVEFKLSGFLLVISAAFFSGFRWGLTQLLLLRNPATSNPFSSIFFLSPIMFITLFAMAIPVEGFGDLFEGLGRISQEFGTVMTPIFLLFPGCIAFLMIASEFALLQRTSVVTLSIAGIFKEVVTISAASLIFHDELSFVNFIGLLTTLVAIGAYNYVKISKMRAEAQEAAHGPADNDKGFASNSASDVDNDDANEESAGLLQHGEPNAPLPAVAEYQQAK
ncbi:solute carrier family 35 member C2 [Cordyceps javanica]|uniref:Solute carrier family 35 member C2 n=1 Tax=Cordyceps javanica TaxID=43265 RepID=A0A545VZI9_9HYPO|nr:solute carrier family 35 member C2 [Cordyceps javanica]TQW07136.1 solute carrier family 35 member C2 [Cordyceps javanica]